MISTKEISVPSYPDTISTQIGDVEQGMLDYENDRIPSSQRDKKYTEHDFVNEENEETFAFDQPTENLTHDVYNMFFLSKIGSASFFYAAYVFLLKLTVFSLLSIDALRVGFAESIETSVKVAQFLMLPVAIAIQDDLTNTYYIVINVQYTKDIQRENPHARKWKFHCANVCRAVDGHFSLFVNFVILLTSTSVLSLMLNFAALQFLQTIDNIALELAAKGYLSKGMEIVAGSVKGTELSKKQVKGLMQYLDSIVFVSLLIALAVGWGVLHF
jgi:hypothetical protein